MAHILSNPNRRDFIKFTTLTGLGITTYSNKLFAAGASAHIAFLSDVHIPADADNNYRGFYPYKSLEKAVPQVIKANAEAAIISGDLARLEGLEGDYKNLHSLLQPVISKMPVGLALGNHDDRDNFEKVFASTGGVKQDVKGKHVVILEQGPVRIIVLDSLLYVNKVAGLLGKVQRTWLENYLNSANNTPTLLVVHHTPGDNDGDLLDVDKLYEIIKNRKQVKAIIYGHSHEYSYSMRDNVHWINLPAVAYNFNDNEPTGWVEAKLTDKKGKFTLRTIGGNQNANGQETVLNWR